MGGSREGWTLRDPTPPSPSSPGKSQVTIGFLRNSGKDLPREAIGPLGSNCPIASRVRPSVEYVVDKYKKEKKQDPPLLEFSGSAYEFHCEIPYLT